MHQSLYKNQRSTFYRDIMAYIRDLSSDIGFAFIKIINKTIKKIALTFRQPYLMNRYDI